MNSQPDTKSSLSPGPDALKFSDDEGLFCCLVEILMLAGLVTIGVLGANAIIWLIEQGDKD